MFVEGMQDLNMMRRIYNTVTKYHRNFAFLQCTSSYPLKLEDVNLAVIDLYRETFPDVVIGYSGHESGTHISLGAIAKGAKVLERHITLDKSWKGSDHKASLEIEELKLLMTQIRELETAIGVPKKELLQCEKNVIARMGKSFVAVGDLKAGDVLTRQNTKVKHAEPYGIPTRRIHELMGSTLKKDVADDDTILEDAVEWKNKPGQAGKFVCLILARSGLSVYLFTIRIALIVHEIVFDRKQRRAWKEHQDAQWTAAAGLVSVGRQTSRLLRRGLGLFRLRPNRRHR